MEETEQNKLAQLIADKVVEKLTAANDGEDGDNQIETVTTTETTRRVRGPYDKWSRSGY